MDPFNPTQEELAPEAIADRVAHWIDELPKHPKANGQLVKPNGHCCLGVAAKLVGIPDDTMSSTPTKCYEAIRRLYGLRTNFGRMKEEPSIGFSVSCLTSANDMLFAHDTDHARTAEFIERELHRVWDEPLATLIEERMR